MKDPNMRARISQLHKTEAAWNLLLDFVPMRGEFVVFDPDDLHDCARLKIGDGTTKLRDLPFFIDRAIDTFISNGYAKIIDAGRVTDYKK